MSEPAPSEPLCSSCRKQELRNLGWALVCPYCDEIEPAQASPAQPPSA